MNKIGIMTFHKSINYGSVLQAYALQQAVNKLGFSSEVIDYEPDNYKYLYGYFRIPKNSTNIKHDIINLRNLPLLIRRRKKFAEFRNRSLKLSSKQYKFGDNMQALDDDYNFVICGSDQIWNPKAKDSDVNYFLPNSLNVKKISYAVSLNDGGASEFDNPHQYKKYLMDFDALSVREQSGKRELERFLENKKAVEVVLDPSLLHKKETYYPICSERIVKQPYIFFYSVNHNKSTIEAVNILSKRLNLPVYYLYTNTSTRRTYKTYPEFEYMKHDVAPQDFISLIRYADFVITDSFHGTAFSIAFEKKFYSIGKTDSEGKKIRDERICNILASLGIEDRFITQTDAESVDFADIDYKDVNAKREALIELSLGYLKDALLSQFSLDNRYITPKSPTFDWQICKSDDCTGCFACMNKCPKQAIDCVTDSQGRTLPQINPSKCVKCGLCKSVCPVNTPVNLNTPISCYAAQRPDESARKNSSSGGVGAVLAEEFIKSNGAVYGAVVGENAKIVHACAQTFEDIEKFKGSKYVQSYIGYIYSDVLSHLNNNKKVLFTGTPCQIAGLRNFLNKDYDNLYCVDLICHGTPPMQYLTEHIKSVTGENADFVSFRGGDKDYVLKIKSGGKELYSKFQKADAYFTAFMSSLICRENCYSCRYAQTQRCSDMTIGDFWGLDRQTLKTDQKGRISVVLVNTEKGKDLFDAIKDNLVFEERDLKEAADGNDQLRYPSVRHKNRTDFINKYELTGDFENSVLSCGVEKQIKAHKRSRTLPYRAVRKFKRLFFK